MQNSILLAIASAQCAGDAPSAEQSGTPGTTEATAIPPSAAGMAIVNHIEEVVATVETEPVPDTEDAADDVAIWINAADPSKSTIIGTNKKGGIAVYDLAGKQIQYLADGELNNVDLRPDFQLGGQPVALVTASNRGDNRIAIHRVNPSTHLLEDVAARKITTVEAYGCCMYRSRKTDRYYYLVTSKTGWVEQWELFDNEKGRVDGRRVRVSTWAASQKAA